MMKSFSNIFSPSNDEISENLHSRTLIVFPPMISIVQREFLKVCRYEIFHVYINSSCIGTQPHPGKGRSLRILNDGGVIGCNTIFQIWTKIKFAFEIVSNYRIA